MYPHTRLRRNRSQTWIRELLAETTLTTDDLILPLFVVEGKNVVAPIEHLPDVNRYSVDEIVHVT